MTKESQLGSDAEEKPKRKRKSKKMDPTEPVVTEKPPTPYRCPDLGFHFTPVDIMMIKVACRRAAKRMLTYGQGPVQPQIDLTHYENSKPEE